MKINQVYYKKEVKPFVIQDKFDSTEEIPKIRTKWNPDSRNKIIEESNLGSESFVDSSVT